MRKAVTLLLIAAAIAVLTGCEDDSSSSSNDIVLDAGNSSIRGNVTEPEVIAANAIATLRVWLKGTTSETYTDQNGNFVIENVPDGEYTVCFVINGVTFEYPVTVSDNVTIVLSNVSVSPDGSLIVGSVHIIRPPSEPEPDPAEAGFSVSDASLSGFILRSILVGGDPDPYLDVAPAFSPSVTSYTFRTGASDLEIGFTLTNPNANMTVNGEVLASGETLYYERQVYTHPSGDSGVNGDPFGPWTVVVTSQDGTVTATYQISHLGIVI